MFFLTSFNKVLHPTILHKQANRQMTILPLIKVVFPFDSNLPTILSLSSKIFDSSKASSVLVPWSWAI
jgi:hypothetical protein